MFYRRGESLIFSLCGSGEETSFPIFLHCEVMLSVWEKVFWWLSFNFLIPHNLFVHFECWNAEVRNKKLCKGYWLIWRASIWVIRKTRYDRIFKDISKGVEDIVDDIKFLS